MSVMQDTQYHRVAVLLPERVGRESYRIPYSWKQLPISSGVSMKSPMLKFSCIRCRCTDLGMATTPRCKCQRSTTCAADLSYLRAIPVRISSVNNPFRPSAKGPMPLLVCRVPAWSVSHRFAEYKDAPLSD